MVSRGVLPIGRRSGGAELVAFELARHLALRGHQVTLVAQMDEPLMDNAPAGLSVRQPAHGWVNSRLVHLIPVNFPRWLVQHFFGNMRAASCAVKALSEADASFDLVHAHGALATIRIARAIRRSRMSIPVVYTEHDSTPWMCPPRGILERMVRKLVYRSINLRACRYASVVVTSYAALVDDLARRAGLSADRFAVVPNGVNTGSQVVSHEGIGDLPTPKEPRFCLFVGSLIERKAPDLLLHALARSKTNMGLVFVGGGPMMGDLQRLAKRLYLSDRIVFTGAQPQKIVYRYYREAAFLVLPSFSETLPLVLMEALSAGKPVVATRLRGISNIVHDGDNGILVPPGDVAALSSALSLLANDHHSYARLASNAAASVQDRYSWSAITRQLESSYAEKLTPRTGTRPAISANFMSRLRPRVSASATAEPPSSPDAHSAGHAEEKTHA